MISPPDKDIHLHGNFLASEKQRLGDLPAFAKGEETDLMQFAIADDEARLLIEKGSTPKVLPSANSKWFQQMADNIVALVPCRKVDR